MTFGPFEIPEEELLEACKRLERAQAISPGAVLSFDVSARSMVIQGSDGCLYHVRLDGCECVDYERRQLPCKHIYRLALDLGCKFPEAPAFDPYLAAEYDISEDLDRLRRRWVSGQLTLAAYSKCVDALRSSAAKAKHRRGRPKNNDLCALSDCLCNPFVDLIVQDHVKHGPGLFLHIFTPHHAGDGRPR